MKPVISVSLSGRAKPKPAFASSACSHTGSNTIAETSVASASAPTRPSSQTLACEPRPRARTSPTRPANTHGYMASQNQSASDGNGGDCRLETHAT